MWGPKTDFPHTASPPLHYRRPNPTHPPTHNIHTDHTHTHHQLPHIKPYIPKTIIPHPPHSTHLDPHPVYSTPHSPHLPPPTPALYPKQAPTLMRCHNPSTNTFTQSAPQIPFQPQTPLYSYPALTPPIPKPPTPYPTKTLPYHLTQPPLPPPTSLELLPPSPPSSPPHHSPNPRLPQLIQIPLT
ncbi:extensin-like [Homalodisca vitripennis]|uniref:extensin-like n=1 Tax=Homalodisca vitripennis TaxID=197043 RepID=UPI001EE9BC60|nr:extensin-like [Homalodisca vitripennis]